MKKLVMIFTLLAALFVAGVTALAAPSLVDDAGVLTAAEREQVLAELQKQEKLYDVRMAVVLKKDIGDEIPGKYANKLIDDVYNDGDKGNIVLLQVTSKRKWYISTDKKLKEVVVGTDGVEYISKPMVAKLKQNKSAAAYITYAQRAGELLAFYAKEGKGWTPDSQAYKLARKVLPVAPSPSLVDAGGFLTQAQRDELLALLQQKEQTYGVRLGVVSVEPIAGMAGMLDNELGKALLQTGYTNGKNGGMVLLLVRTDSGAGAYSYIATNAKIGALVSADGKYRIQEAVGEKVRVGDYPGAVAVYIEEADKLLAYYQEEGEPWDEGVEFSYAALIIAMVLAAIPTWIVAGGYKASMSNVSQKVEADSYVKNFTIEHSKDIFLRREVIVTERSKSSSSSGHDYSSSDYGTVTDDYSDDNHGGGGGSY